MTHPERNIREYPRVTRFGNEAEGSRKRTLHSPTKFSRNVKPGPFYRDAVDRGK